MTDFIWVILKSIYNFSDLIRQVSDIKNSNYIIKTIRLHRFNYP